MGLGKADDLPFTPARPPVTDDTLGQPCAKGVERVDAAHVEGEGGRAGFIATQAVNQQLELARVAGRPCAAGRHHQLASDDSAAQ